MDEFPDDELQDIEEQAREVGKLTPREMAKLLDVYPQQVYKEIREGRLELEWCICGRRVVDVAKATDVFQAKARKRRGVLDTRPDEDRE